MPLVASSQLRTTILGQEYVVDATLTLPDLPASPYVDFTRCLKAVSLSTNMDTDVPDGVRPPSGLDYTGGTFVLGGFVDPTDETKTVSWLFDPDNANSPLYHLTINDCRVLFTFGAYTGGSPTAEMPTRFDGYVNGYDLDPQTGTVALNVSDVPPSWRSTPSIPGVITVPPYNAGLTGEFAMDQLIRAMDGDSSWPATRPQCVLSVGMRTSVTPEVGTLGNQFAQPIPIFGPGAFGSALVGADNSAGGYSGLLYNLAGNVNDDAFLELEIGDTPGSATIELGLGGATDDTIFLDITGTGLTLSTGHGSYTWTTTLGAGKHYISAKVHWPLGSNSWSVTFTKDAATNSSGTQTSAHTRHEPFITASVGWVASVFASSVEAVQVTTETAPASNYGFVPHFVCDPSLNPLDAVPPVAADPNNSPYSVLQSIAGAENGFIRRQHSPSRTDGVWVFTNRVNLLGQAVADPITSNESIKTLGTSVPASSYSRTIRVPYTGWSFDDPAPIWTIPGKKKVPAGQTLVWQQKINQLAAAIDGTVNVLPTGASAPTGGASWYAASRDRNGLVSHGDMTVTARLLQPDLIEITAANPGQFDAWFVVPGDAYTVLTAGTPSLWIGGTPATQMGEAVVQRPYGDGKGVLTLSSNPYIQDHDTAAALGDFWLNQLYVSYRDLANVSIVPRADLDIADLRRLTETNAGYFDDYVLIWGWSLDIEFPSIGDGSGGTFDMAVSAKAIAPPGAPLGGQIPNRFEVGSFWAYAS